MARHRKDPPIKRFFASRLFLLLALGVAILFAIGYARAYYQDYKIRQEISELKEDAKRLEKKKLESLDLLEYVMSDAYVEEKARTELNLKKPGEQVLVLQNTDHDEESIKKHDPAPGQRLSNPIKWWYYLTKKKYYSENT